MSRHPWIVASQGALILAWAVVVPGVWDTQLRWIVVGALVIAQIILLGRVWTPTAMAPPMARFHRNDAPAPKLDTRTIRTQSSL